ncbi:MAG: YfhO family protein [Lachnospiraceae bacterium]|nr:YfhO family protein [Lachnospiraceae bacterium]
MKKSIESRLNKKNYLTAFLLNLMVAAIAFSWTIIKNRGLFTLAGDFNAQQIPFAMHANDMIRAGEWGFDYTVDLGSSFLGSMSFYVLGTPGFWISMLIPSKYFMYAVGWLYVLKYAIAGLTGYMWFVREVSQPKAALAASLLYAFSGFMNENLLFYHFHDVVMLFPLMMVTLDLLVQKKVRGPFIFAVALNALVNYYFLIGEIIFLAVYYVIRYWSTDLRKYGRIFWNVLLEGAVGCVMTMALLFPAFLFVIKNPRVKMDYMGNNSLVFSAQRYLFILKALLFPGEVMSDHTAVISRNFSSCAAYLPMVGILLVCAFMLEKKKHWLTKMLWASVVMACIPILNAAFSLFAGLYCRWYYMPILMMSLASAFVIDEAFPREEDEYGTYGVEETERLPYPTDRAVTKAFIIVLILTVFFLVYVGVVPWSENERTLVHRPVLFWVYGGISLLGTAVTWLILRRLSYARFRIFLAALLVFATLTTAGQVFSYQAEHGLPSDELLDEIETSAQLPIDDMHRFQENENTRTLVNDNMPSGNFCSTVSGSIFRLYQALGEKRDVKSPDPPPEGFYNLVSAKYDIVQRKHEPGVEWEDDGTESKNNSGKRLVAVSYGKYRDFAEYADDSIPPIGFTYNSYITASQFEKVTKDKKILWMLKALVIPDDKEELVSDVLVKLDPETDKAPMMTDLGQLSSMHLAECSEEFMRDSKGFRSVITADAEKYAFFSIANDDGWTAKVNGVDAEILDINGLMAVRIKGGRNTIEFSYRTPGLTVGIFATMGALIFTFLYVAADLIAKLVRKLRKKE